MIYQKVILLTSSLFFLFGCANVDNAWCPPIEQPETPKITHAEKKVENITLSADALFKFDKSSLGYLLPESNEKLNDFIDKVKINSNKIDYLSVIGHTDRLGSDSYNYNLGYKRAESVKELLNKKGVDLPIKVISMGKSDPVTTGCYGNINTLKECLQPDRRVDIKVYYK